MSKVFISIGLIFLLVGLLLFVSEHFDMKIFSWFGNLPGDIKIEKENFRLYFPVTSMLLISIVLSLLITWIKRWF